MDGISTTSTGCRLRWGAWVSAMVFLALAFAYTREKRGLFFLGYIFITLLPVVFLVNHRYEFFWYIPFFGVAGLAALVTAAIEKRLSRLLPERALQVFGVIAFVLSRSDITRASGRPAPAFLKMSDLWPWSTLFSCSRFAVCPRPRMEGPCGYKMCRGISRRRS